MFYIDYVGHFDELSMSLIHCFELIKEAYNHLVKEEANDEVASGIIADLESSVEYGKYLKRIAEDYLEELILQEINFHKTLEQLQENKIAIEDDTRKLKQDMAVKEMTYSSNEINLKLNKEKLQEAENEFTDAKRKFNTPKVTRGRYYGKVSPKLEKKMKTAKKNLDKQKTKVKSLENATSVAKWALSEAQNKIEELEAKIQAIQKQMDQKQKETDSVESSIVLLRESSFIWEEFVVAAGNPEERGRALKSVHDHIAMKKDYKILREDGTVTKTNSFVNAWAIIATSLKTKKE